MMHEALVHYTTYQGTGPEQTIVTAYCTADVICETCIVDFLV